MAINNNNKNVTDKFGRTGIVETTISASSNAEDITLVVNNGSPNGSTTVIPIPDFWRKSSVSGTTLPTGLNSFTSKPNNSNDTTSFIQHSADVFIGGADGLVRAGQGAGNIATNTVFGKNALRLNTSGNNNTAFGLNSLSANTTGSGNNAMGFNSLLNLSTGVGNVGIGRTALVSLTVNSNNTAVGNEVGLYATGSQNAFYGVQSGYFTTGSFNTFIGPLSGSSVTGNNNINIGFRSGYSNTTTRNCSYNIAIGDECASRIASTENVIMGRRSGYFGTGTDNVMIGSWNYSDGTGLSETPNNNINKNTFVGNKVNYSTSAQVAIGDNNSALGYGCMLRVAGITNSTALGANTASTKSNQISMGNSAVTEVLLSGKLAIDINALSAAADGTPIVIRTVSGVKTITI